MVNIENELPKNDNTYLDTNIYTSKICQLLDEFILLELNNNHEKLYKNVKLFSLALLYIQDNLKELEKTSDLDLKNVYQLDQYFNTFYRLCLKYSINPSLNLFGNMCGITVSSYNSFSGKKWNKKGKEYLFVKKWKDMCGSNICDDLANSEGFSGNKVFIANQYGYSNKTEVIHNDLQSIGSKDIKQLLEEYGEKKSLPDLDDI